MPSAPESDDVCLCPELFPTAHIRHCAAKASSEALPPLHPLSLLAQPQTDWSAHLLRGCLRVSPPVCRELPPRALHTSWSGGLSAIRHLTIVQSGYPWQRPKAPPQADLACVPHRYRHLRPFAFGNFLTLRQGLPGQSLPSRSQSRQACARPAVHCPHTLSFCPSLTFLFE